MMIGWVAVRGAIGKWHKRNKRNKRNKRGRNKERERERERNSDAKMHSTFHVQHFLPLLSIFNSSTLDHWTRNEQRGKEPTLNKLNFNLSLFFLSPFPSPFITHSLWV